ncbi:hypothetical protein ACUTAF_07995 [Pseudomonas sp. SP16.1]|uniref:hypothetical protein n=1 Tax=Pseudomonas sp. SP16.1 TaxID=3458854 RepID=UPI00404661ED
MAKNQRERDLALAERRQKAAETELRHRVRPGIKARLADLMAWHGIEEQAEAIQLLIINAHAAGPIGSAPMLAIPRHEFTPSENVARQLYAQGEREAGRLDQQDH